MALHEASFSEDDLSLECYNMFYGPARSRQCIASGDASFDRLQGLRAEPDRSLAPRKRFPKCSRCPVMVRHEL